MILNKFLSLSLPRLLHVALSLLCVLALVLGLAFGALAASGDSSGYLTDFGTLVSFNDWDFTGSPVIDHVLSVDRPSSSVSTFNIAYLSSNTFQASNGFSVVFTLPGSLLHSGSVSGLYNIFDLSQFSGSASLSPSIIYEFYDSSFSRISYGSSLTGFNSSFVLNVPTDTQYFGILVFIVVSGSSPSYVPVNFVAGSASYSNFDYAQSSVPGDLSQDILDGVTAIAQSLLDLETGPYSGVSGVTVDSNGDLQHTVVNNATLENLLNAVGIATTDSNFVLRGMYNNFGSFFTYYDIDDSTSGSVVTVHGLPQYISALGSELTDGINRLQRDHDLLYQQTADLASDLSDALYADTDSSPSESWSVAEWLRGIYNSITSFFASFWSPAETDLKEAAEYGMQEAADREISGSADQVGDMDDLGSGFSSFGDTGNVGVGDLLDTLTSGDYSFFSSTTQQNLAYQPPQQNRDLRSSPSEPVEYVDELSKNRDYLREVLGLP